MILVVDDFLNDPDKARKLAFTLKYDGGRESSPFFRSPEGHVLQEIKKKAIPLLKNFKEKDGARKKSDFEIRSFFQYFPKSQKGFIHIDAGDRWSAIVYLNPKPSHFPGTAFYRHKPTQLEYVNAESLQQVIEKKPRFKSVEHIAKTLNKDRRHPENWDLLHSFSGSYNRLLLFRSNQFHQNISVWGTNISNSRLTYNFFLA